MDDLKVALRWRYGRPAIDGMFVETTSEVSEDSETCGRLCLFLEGTVCRLEREPRECAKSSQPTRVWATQDVRARCRTYNHGHAHERVPASACSCRGQLPKYLQQ